MSSSSSLFVIFIIGLGHARCVPPSRSAALSYRTQGSTPVELQMLVEYDPKPALNISLWSNLKRAILLCRKIHTHRANITQ